jgi:uncharacterized protein YdbL (DUF1318 family)
MKFILPIILMLSMTSVWALSLKDARKKGMVGELGDGYIALVSPESANSDAKSLVAEINQKRKKSFQKVAKKNSSPLGVVQKTTYSQIFKKLKSGYYYKNKSGSWVRK